jgi:hypothetical protein
MSIPEMFKLALLEQKQAFYSYELGFDIAGGFYAKRAAYWYTRIASTRLKLKEITYYEYLHIVH